MNESEREASSPILEGITHRYLQVNLIRHELLQMEIGDREKLQKKLEEIDRHVSHPNFINQFLQDVGDYGSYEKTLAYHSQIQGLSYQNGEYGFFDDGGDPMLTKTQKMRLEYAGIIIREALLRRNDISPGLRETIQKHQAHINWLLDFTSGFS